MLAIFTWILGLLKIIIVLGTLITIHELGHFTVAKLCNVKVNKFAIGFGPQIFEKTKGETEYSLRLIPFGGFCQMEGEEEHSDDDRAFNKKSVWQRVAIVAAGAIVNIVFALVVYFFIALSVNEYYSNIVDIPSGDSLYEAGLRSGDRIVKVNGEKVLTGREISEIVTDSKDDNISFLVEKIVEEKSELVEINAYIPKEEKGYLGVAVNSDNEVLYIAKNSPAQNLGLKAGDKIEFIDNESVESPEEIINVIKNTVNDTLNLSISRSGEKLTLSGETESKSERDFNPSYEIIKPKFAENLIYAFDETLYYFGATIKGTLEIFTGKAEDVEVMGPVGIATEISSTKAFKDFFYLMSAISLSLGIFNLLPIPALDGGRILLLIIEGIRKKPFKESVEQGLILAGFAIIMLLAIGITILDILKLF